MTAPLTLRALSRATLARQMLLGREKISAVAAVEKLVGMQAQLVRPPPMGLFSRIVKFDRAELATALEQRKIVRATLMRGTLHYFSAKDYIALRGVIQLALDHGLKSVLRERMKTVDLDEVIRDARAFFAEPRTMDAFRDHIAARKNPGDVRARAFAARCIVPLVQIPGENAYFTLAEPYLKMKTRLKPSSDAREIVRRYLAAFGPASVADAQTWSGIPALRDTFDSIASELVVLQDERKRELFDLKKAPRPDEDTDAPPRFLPEFDNLVLAHADRRRFVADAHRKSIYLPGLRVAPTFLVDGVVAGTWKIERIKKKATLAIAPFGAIDRKERSALDEEAAALVRFAEPDAATFDVISSGA